MNANLEKYKANYSLHDVNDALQYAKHQISITPYEVGIAVYRKLYDEKIIEFLLSIPELEQY